MSDDPRQRLVQAFNELINRRDVDGLSELMSDDHTFVDSAGHTIDGKYKALKAWRGFFAAFPDYQNVFAKLTSQESMVVAVGRSKCSDPRLDGPALWTARIEGGKIAEWRIWDDTPENRRQLGIEQFHCASGPMLPAG